MRPLAGLKRRTDHWLKASRNFSPVDTEREVSLERSVKCHVKVASFGGEQKASNELTENFQCQLAGEMSIRIQLQIAR